MGSVERVRWPGRVIPCRGCRDDLGARPSPASATWHVGSGTKPETIITFVVEHLSVMLNF